MVETAQGDKHLRTVAELHKGYQKEDSGIVLSFLFFILLVVEDWWSRDHHNFYHKYPVKWYRLSTNRFVEIPHIHNVTCA